MHTREQAAGLWCPLVRLAACSPTGGVASGQSVFNRLQNDRITEIPASARCIADQCAMWRWGTVPDPAFLEASRQTGVMIRVPLVQADVGYCGLAGSPAAC